MQPLVHLHIRNPKDDETPIESATQIFASVLPYSYSPLWKRSYKKTTSYSFEIFLINQTIHFYVTAPATSEGLITSLIASSFPQSQITKTPDPLDDIVKNGPMRAGEMVLNSYYYLPIKTYMDFKDIDPLSALVGFLSKQEADVAMAVQIVVKPASFKWQSQTMKNAGHQSYDEASDKYTQNPQKLLMMQKASFQGGKAAIRVMASSKNLPAEVLLSNLAGTFGSFSLGEGNQFSFKKKLVRKKILLERIKTRQSPFYERKGQILNAQELATIWHPPGFLLKGVKNIAWGKTLAGEPPENLPVAMNLSEEEKKDVNFFATTEYKNLETIFGIKAPDRRKHTYIIGKTGAGKSTLIANMAIDDIRKDRGIGIIDPHGDLSETILDFVPKRRLNDVVYLEPFDVSRPFSLNVLEVNNKQQKELVASGIVAIFYKLYGNSWGPRLEYILRNVIFTLLETPDATLVDVLRILTDEGYRKRVVSGLTDPVILNFWEKEFARMPDSMRVEAVAPIQNKVGQFVSSKMIRNIVGVPKSSVNLEDIMNEGKILILNLSQGKLGEDNASLLGAMIITQMQLAAMNRSFMREEERRDFFMYVDEFQNFATSSFIKILSEARKYRLALTLANQYMGQLDLEVQKSILGNVGSLVSFVVSGTDAYVFSKEFAEIYTENDLVSLGKFETVLKLSIDGMTSAPFPARTLPLPAQKNENKDAIIRLSKERYGHKPIY